MNKQKVMEKNNNMDSIVDIAARSPSSNREQVANHPSCCSNIVVGTILFILIVLIITLGQYGFHDSEDLVSKHKPENENKAEEVRKKHVEESRWIKATNNTCYSSQCIEMSNWLTEREHETTVERWRIQKYEDLMKEGGTMTEVLKFVKAKCLESIETDEIADLREVITVVEWPENLITDPSLYPQVGLLRFDYPTPTTVRISAEVLKESQKDTEWRIQMVFQHLLTSAGATVNLEEIRKYVKQIHDFKNELSQIVQSDELQKVELSQLQAVLSSINWAELFGSNENGTIKADMAYLENLSYLLGNTSQAIVSNYLFFKTIENFSPFMGRKIRNIFWIGHLLKPEENCMIQMDKLFSGKVPIPGIEEVVQSEKLTKIVEDIQVQIHHSIKNNGWVKKDEYLENGKISIRYCPNTILLESLNEMLNDSMNYFSAVQMISQNFQECNRIHYSVSDRVLEIPTSFLQPPFFHPESPDYLNYANIGSFIADEMLTQLLYETDSHFDKCYENPAFEHLPGDIAYRAYNKEVKNWDRLTGFEGFNDKELFQKSLCKINLNNDRFECNSDIDKTICYIFDTH